MQLHKQATECKTFQVQTLLGGGKVHVKMLLMVPTCLLLHNQQETRCKNTQWDFRVRVEVFLVFFPCFKIHWLQLKLPAAFKPPLIVYMQWSAALSSELYSQTGFSVTFNQQTAAQLCNPRRLSHCGWTIHMRVWRIPTRLEMVRFKCVAIGVGEQLQAVHQCDIMDQRPGSPRAHFQNPYAPKTAHISF